MCSREVFTFTCPHSPLGLVPQLAISVNIDAALATAEPLFQSEVSVSFMTAPRLLLTLLLSSPCRLVIAQAQYVARNAQCVGGCVPRVLKPAVCLTER